MITILILISLCLIDIGNAQCLPVWSNRCDVNKDCCSNNCLGSIPDWQYGVCQPGDQPTQSAPPQSNPTQTTSIPISWDEFNNAVTNNGYPSPSRDQYNNFVNRAMTTFSSYSKQELAMFLSQILWNSNGLRHKKALACAQTQCPNEYRTGREALGKYYYPRGYIQLTWLYNYKSCSQDMYGDNRLVKNPDLVSDNEDAAWASAFWFWNKNVHDRKGVSQGNFGASTNAINGDLECKGQDKDKARKRFQIYIKVLRAFNLNNVVPNENGCYN